VIVATGAQLAVRRRRLKDRFGPEYDRVVTESQSRRLAEAELAKRQQRVRKLDLHELSDSATAKYQAEWTAIQERFVEAPDGAVVNAQRLIETVLRDVGYPDADYEQTAADLSVEHADVLDSFRSAHDVAAKAGSGQATTEELRQALLGYRALLSELIGEPTDGSTQQPVASAAPLPAEGSAELPVESAERPAEDPELPAEGAELPTDGMAEQPSVNGVEQPAVSPVEPTAVDDSGQVELAPDADAQAANR
jgi:hypothetical protein